MYLMLGGALNGQKKRAEAEPLMVQGYEGMKQRAAQIPLNGKPRLAEALERLVQLYDAWGKPDKAARWRSELESEKAARNHPIHSLQPGCQSGWSSEKDQAGP
jgi:hypothetical protein